MEEYRIVSPKKIEKVQSSLPTPKSGECIVKITNTQICDADAKYYYGLRPKFPYEYFGFRYFFGVRSKKELNKKYPLVPIHEAIGFVEDSKCDVKKGSRVVLIPSVSCQDNACEICNGIGENYCSNARFMSSNMPGFARTHVLMPCKNIARIPEGIPDEVAIFSEMSTVVYGALDSSGIDDNDSVLIFGDGHIAYILALLAHKIYQIPKNNLYVSGKHEDKLSKFSDFCTVIKNPEESGIRITKAFECVGKRDAEKIINDAVKIMRPGGTIILIGVSEENVPINTRDILSKNITLRGVSRSPAIYYPKVLDVMKDKHAQELYLRLKPERIKIRSEDDIKKAFEAFMVNRKKLLMDWT